MNCCDYRPPFRDYGFLIRHYHGQRFVNWEVRYIP